jgi:hypothetical protein
LRFFMFEISKEIRNPGNPTQLSSCVHAFLRYS